MTAPTITVPKPLGPEQVRQYLDEGYLEIHGLLTPREIAILREEVVKFARGDYPLANFRPLPKGASDEDAMRRLLVVDAAHAASSAVSELIRQPRICGVISQIAAAHRRGWDGSAKFVQSTLYVKPPGAQGHPWHQDDRAIRTWDQSLCAAWIPLDDATVDNGCLWVIPGSHRKGYLYPLCKHNKPDFAFNYEAHGFDDSEAVQVEVRAGSMLFFSGSLLHRSLPNRSQSFRRAFVHHYTSAWTELPWFDHAEDKLRNDLRTVIPVAGTDPYAWKGYEPVSQAYCRWQDPAA